MENEFIKHSSK